MKKPLLHCDDLQLVCGPCEFAEDILIYLQHSIEIFIAKVVCAVDRCMCHCKPIEKLCQFTEFGTIFLPSSFAAALFFCNLKCCENSSSIEFHEENYYFRLLNASWQNRVHLIAIVFSFRFEFHSWLNLYGFFIRLFFRRNESILPP